MMPYGSLVALGDVTGAGKDLAQVVFHAQVALPVAGITQRHLFKADAIAPVGGAHVQVPVYHAGHRESLMQILGQGGAAPDLEAGNTRQAHQVVAQREVVDNNLWNIVC